MLCFCFYSEVAFADSSWDSFNLDFGNKKIFQLDRYKGKYSFTCTSYIGSNEKMNQRMFIMI